MAVELTDGAAVASAVFTAWAAGASWMSVRQSRKAFQEAQRAAHEATLPELHVDGFMVPPAGPLPGARRTRIEFTIYNAGGGVARAVGYLLFTGMEYVTGFVAPGMVAPGAVCRVVTELTPTTYGGDWGGIVTCFDRENARRSWRLPDRKPMIGSYDEQGVESTMESIFQRCHPGVRLSDLQLKDSKTEPAQLDGR